MEAIARRPPEQLEINLSVRQRVQLPGEFFIHITSCCTLITMGYPKHRLLLLDSTEDGYIPTDIILIAAIFTPLTAEESFNRSWKLTYMYQLHYPHNDHTYFPISLQDAERVCSLMTSRHLYERQEWSSIVYCSSEVHEWYRSVPVCGVLRTVKAGWDLAPPTEQPTEPAEQPTESPI